MDFNLSDLRKDKVDELPVRPAVSESSDRHVAMKDAIKAYAKPPQKNLTTVDISYKTRKTRILWVLCPEWAPEFPPFNLARLSGVCKAAGYESHILDLNIKVHNLYMYDWRPNNKLPFLLWNPASTWHWLGSSYYEHIHPLLQPILDEAVDNIIADAPDIIGFTQYYLGEECTNYMARELKRKAPHIKLAVGGSNVHKDWFNNIEAYDYVVSGEGEQIILEILEGIENGTAPTEQQIIRQPENQRINISDMPMPDYAELDFADYTVPNGVTSEFSRGCTAKCTFCDETHFWRYRRRRADAVLEEAEWLWYEKGVDIMWFIDSLVNGDPDELRAFALGIAAKGLPTKWTGYARCDGRMDDDYYRDLAAGGCIMLNYGCESGSQRVLDLMHKGVTIKEMEDNFALGKKHGVWAATNWIVGFPNEELVDFAQTMAFLWRNKDMNINNVGAGVGMAIGPESIVGQNPHRFGAAWHNYQGHWIRKDLSWGGTHMMHRVKFFYMYLDQIVNCAEFPFGYPIRPNLKKEHYKITWHDDTVRNDIEYEDFDYNIISTGITPWADNLVNEVWPLLRMLWLTRGGFDIEIDFNPEIDLKEFGTQYGPAMYNGRYIFSIDHDGNWEADFKYRFDQVDNPLDDRPDDDPCKGPFYAQDYSYMKSNPALRARKLAKPSWGMGGRSESDWHELISESIRLNAEIDYTFRYEYQNTGKWDKLYNIDVPAEQTNTEPDNPQLSSMIKVVNV